MNVGDVYYEENTDTQTVNFVVGGAMWLSVSFGIGSMNVQNLPPRHLPIASKCIAQPYYEKILAIRDSGTWDSLDMKPNLDQIKSRLDKINETLEADLALIGTIPMLHS